MPCIITLHGIHYYLKSFLLLVSELSLEELTVKTCDVGD